MISAIMRSEVSINAMKADQVTTSNITCSFCSFECESLVEFGNHLKGNHDPFGDFSCTQCSQFVGKNVEDLQLHRFEKHANQPASKHIFNLKKLLKDGNTVSCPLCKVVSTSTSTAKQHALDAHGIYFEDAQLEKISFGLEEATRKTSPAKSVKLENRGKAKGRSPLIQSQEQLQSLPKFQPIIDRNQFKPIIQTGEASGCPYCSFSSKLGHKVKEHVDNAHELTKWYRCHKCNKAVLGSNTLTIHLQVEHGHELQRGEVAQLLVAVEKEVNDLRQMYIEHHRSLSQKIADQKDFKFIISKQVDKQQYWTCPYCKDVKETSEVKMSTHINLTHEGTKWWKCPSCEEVILYDPERVTMHQQKTHPNEDFKEASQCIIGDQNEIETLRKLRFLANDQFIRSPSERKKRRENEFVKITDPRDFKPIIRPDSGNWYCPYCDFFSDTKKEIVTNHMNVKHEGSKWWKCPHCQEAILYAPSSVWNHKRARHPKEDFQPPNKYFVKDKAEIEKLRKMYFLGKDQTNNELSPETRKINTHRPYPIARARFKPILRIEGSSTVRYGCPYCNFEGNFFRTFSHVNTRHEFRQWINCSYCPKVMLFGHNILWKHVKLVHPNLARGEFSFKKNVDNIIKDPVESERLRKEHLANLKWFDDEATEDIERRKEDVCTPIGDKTLEDLLHSNKEEEIEADPKGSPQNTVNNDPVQQPGSDQEKEPDTVEYDQFDPLTDDNIIDQEEKFECDMCVGIFKSFELLDDHAASFHYKIFAFHCSKCTYNTYSELNFCLHAQTSHDLTLDKKDITLRKIASNIKVAKFMEEETFRCKDCNKMFDEVETANDHSNVEHETKYEYACSKCSVTLVSGSEMKQHTLEVHQTVLALEELDGIRKIGLDRIDAVDYDNAMFAPKGASENEFKCGYCTFRHRDEHTVKNHLNAGHFKSVYFQCKSCTFKTFWRSQLILHSKKVHEEELSLRNSDETQVFGDHSNLHLFNAHPLSKTGELRVPKTLLVGDDIVFRCSYGCDFQSYAYKQCASHIERKHEKAVIYACTQCHYFTTAKHIISSHMNQHDLPADFESLLVTEVKKIRVYQQKLEEKEKGTQLKKDVVKDKHLSMTGECKSPVPLKGLGSFKCPYCEYSSFRTGFVWSHINTEHERTTFFACNKCDFYSMKKKQLMTHLQREHSSNINFVQVAKLKVKDESKIKDFQSKGTSERLPGDIETTSKVPEETKSVQIRGSTCPYCKADYKGRLRLEDHINSIHDFKYEYGCDICDYKARWHFSLSKHLWDMHEIRRPPEDLKQYRKDVKDEDDVDCLELASKFLEERGIRKEALVKNVHADWLLIEKSKGVVAEQKRTKPSSEEVSDQYGGQIEKKSTGRKRKKECDDSSFDQPKKPKMSLNDDGTHRKRTNDNNQSKQIPPNTDDIEPPALVVQPSVSDPKAARPSISEVGGKTMDQEERLKRKRRSPKKPSPRRKQKREIDSSDFTDESSSESDSSYENPKKKIKRTKTKNVPNKDESLVRKLIENRNSYFLCPECDFQSKKDEPLRTHLIKKHGYQHEGSMHIFQMDSTGNVPLICKEVLSMNSFICPMCAEEYCGRDLFTSHVEKSHGKEYFYKCSVVGCLYKNRFATSLKKHLRNQHKFPEMRLFNMESYRIHIEQLQKLAALQTQVVPVQVLPQPARELNQEETERLMRGNLDGNASNIDSIDEEDFEIPVVEIKPKKKRVQNMVFKSEMRVILKNTDMCQLCAEFKTNIPGALATHLSNKHSS